MPSPLQVLCTGDVHLGRRPSRVPVENDKLSVRRVWDRFVETALNREVDAAVLTGDIVDSENQMYEAYGALERGIQGLVEGGVEVVAVAGNHDHSAFPRLARSIDLDGFHLLGQGGTYKTVLGMSHKVKEGIYDRREEWLEALTGEVEADNACVKEGQQGREVTEQENGREARDATAGRGPSARGRGSYETDHPLVVSWVERGEEGVRVFELRRTAGKKSLLSSALTHVEGGATVHTDTWSGYRLLDEVYDHCQVKHSEQYVSEEGTCCNTAESEWSVFKPWLRTFRGLAKRHLYLHPLGIVFGAVTGT